MKKLIKLLEKEGFEYSLYEWDCKEDIITDYFIQTEMFTPKELQLVTNINGWSEETLNDMLFARFGYRDLEQMLSE